MTKLSEDKELARRAFLAKCGKYALVTPPVVTLLLSTSGRNNYALALSGSTAGASGHSGGTGAFANGGAGGGPYDPGILQSGSGGIADDTDAAIICRSPRAVPTHLRRTACVRPGASFEVSELR